MVYNIYTVFSQPVFQNLIRKMTAKVGTFLDMQSRPIRKCVPE